MSYMHVSHGKVYHFEEPETVDVKVSPALEMLIRAEIINPDNVEFVDFEEYEYRFQLQGPWEGSDYSGDDVCESNQRSLYRDYPQYLTDTTRYSGYGSYGLQIAPTFGQGDEDEAEGAVALAEILIGLAMEYPLYDEEDNSNLIHERASESWDAWVRSDLESDVQALTGLTVDLDSDAIASEFWTLLSEHDIYPEAEGHRDVIFRGIGDRDFLLAMARVAIAAGQYDACDMTHDGYVLVGEFMAEDYAPIPGQMAILV